MDFSNRLIGKSLEALQYGDIENFFHIPQEESDLIEFKSFPLGHGSFDSKIEGVIRGVTAFLNSSGGILIWGAPHGSKKEGNDHVTFVGRLSPLDVNKEKDWLINKVSDSITPLPVDIKVATLSKDGNYVYVFEVQQSQYAPHQYKQTYWARLDGQTKPAPHYLIEALFRRIKFPNIEGYVKFDEINLIQNPSRYIIHFTIGLFNFSRLQNEEDIIYRLVVSPGYIESVASATAQFNEPLLHYGTPMINMQRIVINHNELLNSQMELRIVLTYGGKKSPAKSSYYTLNIGNINLANPQDTAPLIETLVENKLLGDVQDEKGTTRESILQQFLGREIK